MTGFHISSVLCHNEWVVFYMSYHFHTLNMDVVYHNPVLPPEKIFNLSVLVIHIAASLFQCWQNVHIEIKWKIIIDDDIQSSLHEIDYPIDSRACVFNTMLRTHTLVVFQS